MKAILSIAVLASLTAVSSASLIVNGNFEADAYPAGSYQTLTSLTGWSILGDSAGIGVGYLGAPSQEIDLSGVTDNSSGLGIQQSFATVANTQYTLNLDVFAGAGTGYSGGVNVLIDGNQLGGTLQGVRTTHQLSFTATGASTTLTLLSSGGNVSHVDNVSVQAVPEPASMAALGLGALGLLRRRRNAR